MPHPYRFESTARQFSCLALLFALGGCSGSDASPAGSIGGSTSSSSGGLGTVGHGGSGASAQGGNVVGAGGAKAAGGAVGIGGSLSGGTSSNGGALNSGGTLAVGGADSNGGATAKGGTSIGGAATGGKATGGANSKGGGTSGGSGAGGTATGGVATGGAIAAGGKATGGAATGGTTTGGAATGGAATGGANTGTPGCRIVGRTAPGTVTGSSRFSWPGINLNCTFTGTQVSMDVSDGSNKNRFTVVIDGGAPKTVTTTSATSLALATGLATGTHNVVIWRNTEVGFGITQFNGLSNFGTGGALLAPAAAPARRIEVIGDSLSAGAGVEGNATCTGGIDAYTNNYLAYGSVAARAVGADVVTIAWSGIGVYRNYDGSSTNVMPSRYPYSLPNTTNWDFSLYQPQVVVINLGTNDFGAGDPGTAYETAYVNFVKTVRAKYANASFILIDMYGGDRLTRINNVVAALKSGGESKVEMLSVSSAQNNLGCGQHPNTAGQAAMGAVLATRLKSSMGW